MGDEEVVARPNSLSQAALVIKGHVEKVGVGRAGEVKKSCGLGRSAFDSALDELLQLRVLCRVELGRCSVLAPWSREARVWAPQVFVLRNPGHRCLYRAIQSRQFTTLGELLRQAEDACGWSRRRLERRLDRLVDARLLWRVRLLEDINRRRYLALPIHTQAKAILNGVSSEADHE